MVVVGVDEVGRGCVAGPVIAGAAVLDLGAIRRLPPAELCLIRDSKTLSTRQRRKIIPQLAQLTLGLATACASVEEIESLGIAPATFLAMRRALADCAARTAFDVVLIDGKQPISGYAGLQECLVKGESQSFAIAAASIIAKEARDDLMRAEADRYPEYGFDAHVGYATAAHLDSIRTHGPCPLHRRNFAPINRYVEQRHG